MIRFALETKQNYNHCGTFVMFHFILLVHPTTYESTNHVYLANDTFVYGGNFTHQPEYVDEKR